MDDVGRVLVQRLFEEVFTTQNLAAADEIMAEEYIEHAIAPFGREEPGRVDGPSHAREVVEWLTAQFPDLEMAIESLVAEGDMVAVRVRSAGTNRGSSGASRRRRTGDSLRSRGIGTGSAAGGSASIGRRATTSRRCFSWG
jgi:predicted SnoaL-like aldol condensation-catalyzing enzyme